MDILLVDDDVEHAETIANALRAKYPALKVEVARQGVEAIEKSLEEEEEGPSLVIATSMEAVEKKRLLGGSLKNNYRKRIKFLLMTEPQAGMPVVQDVVDGLLQRSIDSLALYAAVEKWLPAKVMAKEDEILVHFQGQPKHSHGKFGILVPRGVLPQEGISLDEEYEVFLKKTSLRKRDPGHP